MSGKSLSADAHVVCLVNFIAPNDIAVLVALAKRVRKLTVLSSVAMEGNRDWQPDWADLDVIVQKTRTITREEKHPGGYSDTNYIHLPLDTSRQLRQLCPDAIITAELGLRTVLSLRYCNQRNRRARSSKQSSDNGCAVVTSINASERSESGRGRLRQSLRRYLLKRSHWITYNGPSCKTHLISLGANAGNMSPFPYAADPAKAYRGELAPNLVPVANRDLALLTTGQLSTRKGIDLALDQLSRWCVANPNQKLTWNLVGSGPLSDMISAQSPPENLTLVQHGHCDPGELSNHYRDNDLMLFPTLSDEWGLVVDEALLSGLPVIGSVHAQAITTLIRDGENGWSYDPCSTTSIDLASVLDRVTQLNGSEFEAVREKTRPSVSDRTPDDAANLAVQAIVSAQQRIATRLGRRQVERNQNP